MITRLKEIYSYRELLKTSIKKEIRGKYKGSFLGVLWSFINPLLMVLVYAIVFPFIMRSSMPHYLQFLITGIIPWTFFTTTLVQGVGTIKNNAGILKKVYFPREILPLSVVTSEAVNFIISTIIILAFVLGYGMGLSKFIIFYPLVLIVQYLLLIGISFIVSSVTVYFRDLQHFIGVILQLLFYAAPIVYSPNSIPLEYQWILKYNPMTYIINAYRNIFYYQTAVELKPLFILIAISAIACIIAYCIFNKLQKGFAEQL